jgi:septum formation protein
MLNDTLILASGSQRRKQLLKECGIRFKAVLHSFDEDSLIIKNPVKLAEQLSYYKAKSVADKKGFNENFVLGVDTIVAVNNKILGKPANKDQAAQFMKILSGRKHKVISGVSIINNKKSIKLIRSDTSIVEFIKINEKFLNYYLDNNLWRGYAGGYAIQESIFNFMVKKINGSFSNIVGLPVNVLYQMLQEIHFKILW